MTHKSKLVLAALVAVAAAVVLFAAPRTSLAGAIINGVYGCVEVSTGSVYCYGTRHEFRQSPTASDFVSFDITRHVNGSESFQFEVSHNNRSYTCWAGPDLAKSWPAAMEPASYFYIVFDRPTQTCTALYLRNDSRYQ